MKTKLSFAIGVGLLLSVAMLAQLPFLPPARAQNPDPSKSQQAPESSDADIQMFGGRIAKSNGAYVLRASSGKTSYMLDDQKAAKHYEGKIVVVTGTIDKTNNLIHVQKIEAVA